MCIHSNEAQIFHQLQFSDNESKDRIKFFLKKNLPKLSNLDETDQLLEIYKLSKERNSPTAIKETEFIVLKYPNKENSKPE